MYNQVYEAIYRYVKDIVDTMDDNSSFSKEISIEIFSYTDRDGLLIKKISSNPLSKSFIDGSNELLFKFSIESIQSYIADDNDYMIKLTQFLDNVAGAIRTAYFNGIKPIIEGFESLGLIADNTSSNIETIDNNKVRSVIDLEFKYLEKRRRKNG